MSRPILFEMLKSIQAGDVVVVYKLDRIARSLKDLLTIQERITDIGDDFKSLTEILDTTSAAGRMIFQILGAFAEFEREMIRERTRVGLRAAMARGAKPGHPRAMSEKHEQEAMQLWRSGRFTKSELAKRYGVHLSSIKRAIRRAGLAQERPKHENQLRLIA